MRLFGTPVGSSPINPEEWAPIGLKYLKQIAEKSRLAYE
jgi:hypothetical protein